MKVDWNMLLLGSRSAWNCDQSSGMLQVVPGLKHENNLQYDVEHVTVGFHKWGYGQSYFSG
jgi:hypothetical protein